MNSCHRSVFIVIIMLSSLAAVAAAQPLGSHVVLVCNDLGMHCMNQSHQYLSVLPPYNSLQAQVIQRGDAATMPQIVTTDLTPSSPAARTATTR